MINLIVNKKSEADQFRTVRKTAQVLSTIVLVLWTVGLAGVLGYIQFKSSKTSQVSNELSQLVGDAAKLSQQEIFARKLEARANNVKDFVAQRGNATKRAKLLLDMAELPVGWLYNRAKDSQTIIVPSLTHDEAEGYVKSLGDYYSKVRLDSIRLEELSKVWLTTVTVTGLKQK